MERPLDTYKENSKSNNLKKQLNKKFIDFYIINKRSKKDFLETDEESSLLKLNKFVPGKIYSFVYDPLYKNKLDYFDTRPLLFCNTTFTAGTSNNIVSGINLNFLPEQAKIRLLDSFYMLFEKELKISYLDAYENKTNLNIQKIFNFFEKWKEILQYFVNTHGIGYQYAYRNYIIDRIQTVRYVEYQHWETIPFILPEEIIGSSIAEIYSTYWKTLKNNIIKSKN